jgi:hypothetical protein
MRVLFVSLSVYEETKRYYVNEDILVVNSNAISIFLFHSQIQFLIFLHILNLSQSKGTHLSQLLLTLFICALSPSHIKFPYLHSLSPHKISLNQKYSSLSSHSLSLHTCSLIFMYERSLSSLSLTAQDLSCSLQITVRKYIIFATHTIGSQAN